MAGDLKAKQKDWNSRLIIAKASLLCDHADRNSCLIHGLDSKATAPYKHNATPEILDIYVVKDFNLHVHMAGCSELSSDHHPILIVTRMDWAAFQACLEKRLPGNPVVVDEQAIDKCVVELTNDIQRRQRHGLQGVDHVPTHGPLFPLVFRMKYA
jgi:hypothetical protein